MNRMTCLCLAFVVCASGCSASPQGADGARDKAKKQVSSTTVVAAVSAESVGKEQLLYLIGVKIPQEAQGALVFVNPTPGEVLDKHSPSFIGAVSSGQSKPGGTVSSDFVLDLNGPVRDSITVALRPVNLDARADQIEIKRAVVVDQNSRPKAK